jgi:hypothetical protein
MAKMRVLTRLISEKDRETMRVDVTFWLGSCVSFKRWFVTLFLCCFDHMLIGKVVFVERD